MSPSPQTPSPGDGPVATSFGQKVFLVAFGLTLFFLGLGLLEGLLAWLDLGDRHLYDDPFVGFDPGSELFGEKRLPDGRRVYATHPGKLSFFDYQEFPAEKSPGTIRIFALGGSTTAGRPYDSKVAFPRWIELYLQAMDPSRRYEVVNAGAISYASYRIVQLMKELVRYRPDLFVIYTGHNEFLEERTYADLIHQSLARKKLRIWLGGLRLYTLTRQGLQRLRDAPPAAAPTTLAGEVATALDGWAGLDLYHRDDELRRSIIEHFEFNLHQMVAIARDHRAGVIFVKPVSNLKDFSPFKSEHPATMSRQEAARVDALLEEGRALFEAGEARAALGRFEQALDADPDYAEAHFRAGQSLFAQGEFEAARAAFVRAKDSDVAPLRALSAIEELVAAVAAQYALPLIELPAILEADCRERYGHAILGNEYLLDHVHPDLPVHSLIAERVIDVLLEAGTVRRQPGWSDAKRQAVYDRVVAALDREDYARRDLNLSKVLTWAGKLEEAEAPLMRAAAVLTDNPEVWLNQGILFEKTGRWQEAVQALRRAVALDPGSAEAHLNLGVNLGTLGRIPEAVASLEEALRLAPENPLAHFNLGVLHRRRGELDRAAAAFERAAELAPRDAAAAHYNLGQVLARQEKPAAAIAAYKRSLELEPGQAEAHNNLGILYARERRHEEAERELEMAIEVDPDYAEAHFNLGLVHYDAGRPGEALRAIEQALELDPGNARMHATAAGLYRALGDAERER